MMNRTRLCLAGLLIAHIAATFALEQIDRGKTLLGALSSSQVGLLGIGLVVGTWRWWWRVGSVVVATAALVAWQWHSQSTFVESFVWILVPELSVAAGFLVARYGPPKLRLIQLGNGVLPSPRFQFSLRQVMALFVVVAIVLGVAKPIRAYVSAYATDEAKKCWLLYEQSGFLSSAQLLSAVSS